MKKFLLIILLVAAQVTDGKTVSVQVIDDLGRPIPEANVSVWFWSVKNSFEDEKKYKSDAEGRVVAQGETMVGYAINAGKDGYYSAKSEPYISPAELVEKTYVLPRILNPVSLYANRFNPGSGHPLSIPERDVWIGYDFAVGDWLPPHGKGKTADILFKFKNEFKGYRDSIVNLEEEKAFSKRAYAARKEEWTEEKYKLDAGKWAGVLEISFPNQKDGLIEEEKRFLPYSELKLPHLAPESDYVSTWRYEANTYSPNTARQDVGFFLRTRVQVNKDGKIVSANYSKLYGDIFLDPRGALSFWYYYNPKPNDRNLEFDLKKNLFPANFPGAKVSNP